MELEKETALIEAILFLEMESTDLKTLCRISGLSKEVVVSAINSLQQKYNADSHGIEVLEIGGGFMFSPKKELWGFLRDYYGQKNKNRLSRAALETLAIIAYSQPITKAEIENLRGVSAEGMLKVLLERNLIREVGKKETPGRPVQYGTTKEFLTSFRLKSISDLPKLDELDRERFELDG
ncbi:MAG: SMC-Scp complex subunit ScpB [Spirochaetota bacterium]